jgi:hypothetical protein
VDRSQYLYDYLGTKSKVEELEKFEEEVEAQVLSD